MLAPFSFELMFKNWHILILEIFELSYKYITPPFFETQSSNRQNYIELILEFFKYSTPPFYLELKFLKILY